MVKQAFLRNGGPYATTLELLPLIPTSLWPPWQRKSPGSCKPPRNRGAAQTSKASSNGMITGMA